MRCVAGRVEINSSITYQSVIGFGGAITDAAAINLFLLSNDMRQKVLNSYFSPSGTTPLSTPDSNYNF